MTNACLLLCVLLGLAACSWPGNDDDKKGNDMEPIARVHNTYLYQKDLRQVLGQGTSPRDSALLVQRYIDSWIKKQLLFEEAARNARLNMDEIEARVQEYRYQLLTYAYQKQFVDENLDTLVTPEQIKTYYNSNQANFELKQNIVKGLLIQVPKDAPNLAKARQWLRSNNLDDLEELKSYTYSFAVTPRISDSTWIDFDLLVVNTPFDKQDNQLQFITRNRFAEAQDDDFIYLLKILDYKMADQVSPLDFVSKQIEEIILNKRKIALQEQLEDKVWENAQKEKSFEVFKKQP